MQTIVETHMHTHHSPDAVDTVDAICRAALAKGLRTVTITDHCDMDLWDKQGTQYTLRQSIEETRAAAERYRGRLEVLTGIELGEPLDSPDRGARALAMADYDLVICSIHSEPGLGDYYYLPDPLGDPHPLLERYFRFVLRHVEWGRFDTLAHLTYPLRYIVGDRGIPVDLRRFDDHCDAIFRALIEKGIALELNTSGWFQRYGRSLPDERLLRRYRELGGELLTIGSDAHRAGDVGRGIERGQALARAVGFTHFVYYRGRQPVRVAL